MNLFVETRGRGPDVVMLHGWGLHGGVFSHVADRLAEHYCVHLVDLPGHGASAPLPQFDADQVADLLDRQFPLPVHVVGWSLGGLIGQHWAARAAIEAVGASLDTDFEATLERFLALQMLGAPAARETLKAVRGELFAHGRPQGLLPALNLLLEADARQLAGRIRCPVGLFFGARDAITPIGAGRWLAENLDDARLYEFPQASHAPFLSHEDDFVARLTTHLDG